VCIKKVITKIKSCNFSIDISDIFVGRIDRLCYVNIVR